MGYVVVVIVYKRAGTPAKKFNSVTNLPALLLQTVKTLTLPSSSRILLKETQERLNELYSIVQYLQHPQKF